MKFLVPIYSCLQNPWLGGYRPRSPFSLSSTEFVEPPPKKVPGHATALDIGYQLHRALDFVKRALRQPETWCMFRSESRTVRYYGHGLLWRGPAAVSHFSHSNVFIYGLVNNTGGSYNCTRGGHDIAATRANCLWTVILRYCNVQVHEADGEPRSKTGF